jgi:hypothetical protein
VALRVFLVHPVEHRKVNRPGVNQLDVFAPPTQPVDQKLGEPDTQPRPRVRLTIRQSMRMLDEWSRHETIL